MLYLELVSERLLNNLSITTLMVFMSTKQQTDSKAIRPQFLYDTFTQHHNWGNRSRLLEITYKFSQSISIRESP